MRENNRAQNELMESVRKERDTMVAQRGTLAESRFENMDQFPDVIEEVDSDEDSGFTFKNPE